MHEILNSYRFSCAGLKKDQNEARSNNDVPSNTDIPDAEVEAAVRLLEKEFCDVDETDGFISEMVDSLHSLFDVQKTSRPKMMRIMITVVIQDRERPNTKKLFADACQKSV